MRIKETARRWRPDKRTAVVLRCLLGGQDEGLQMTKDEVIRLALESFNNLAAWTDGEVGGHMDEPHSAAIARKAITAIKASLEAKDESERTGQPYYWQLDAIQSAINIERENCARLCDAYELPDVAQAIRTRSHR